ncbi:MAG: flagellar biosynthetic protein FliO [Acidobacteriia bacterium]|nr:flagellar biosynthetic protein FliO [Terriglobia bacterium]
MDLGQMEPGRMDMEQIGLTQMELAQMKALEMKLRQREITRTEISTQAQYSRIFSFAAAPLKLIWRSLVVGARDKRKALSVRATVALGDRRFVSVIQFERQRFLIGSSPSSVALLAHLPDESADGQKNTKETGDRN